MSCFPEYRYAIYVDGELEGDALREVQKHLVGCQRCRALVVALEEEASLLGDVLHDRVTVPRALVSARERARGVATGLVPALGVAALLATIGGWLLDLELPAGVGWLSPLKFIGATEMLFTMVLAARDWAPELLELCIAGGVMAGVAAMATFLTGALTRHLSRRFAQPLVLLALLLPLGQAEVADAFELRHEGEHIRIAVGETVEETLVAAGESVTIDGTIEGDLVVLAERFVFTGTVAGNLFAAAGEVELEGEVGGAAHVVGERVRIEGTIARSLYGAAETLTLRQAGSVGLDAHVVGDHVRMEGRAGRDLTAVADGIEIRGSVVRNASTHSGSLVVHEGARIAGNLDIHLEEGQDPEIADEASVGGEISRAPLDHAVDHHRSRWSNPGFYLGWFVFLCSAFLVGMAFHLVVPRIYSAHVSTAADFFRCLGLGFVGLVVTPIFLALCLVTVVGIPIGVIGFFAYLTSLFASAIVVAVLIGSALLGRDIEGTDGSEGAYAFGASLFLGLVIVVVAANLPYLGGLVAVLVLLTGFGLCLMSIYQAWRGARDGRLTPGGV
ncbi:MAG: zf-HC2 domain-containing protein [Gaiellaceae bacterium]